MTVRTEHQEPVVSRSSGGLATGLSGAHERMGGVWVGWPGDVARFTPEQRVEVDRRLAELRCVPVPLTASEVTRFYEGFSNGVLWPLFHYLLDRVPLDSRDWEIYRRANERFADVVVQHYEKGDFIWVHDYQLMLVPGMLRQRIPDARIGFFLHIPFPSWEVFRILPWRQEILDGLLGADLVGFHTHAYMRHFATSLLRIAGAEADVDRVLANGREVRLGAFAMGIDARRFEQLAHEPHVRDEADNIRAQNAGQQILLGIDRLDYTKGIPRRLLAVDRMLERDPSLRGHVKLIQLAVPSREKVPAYEEFKSQVEQLVGHINGTYATPGWTPIHYLYRSLSERQVAALYSAANVMLVTPLRDGMNLVAKEFVASRIDNDGVLVLSEFAGAASELGEALTVNAYDIDVMARQVRRALSMSREEQATRMRALRQRVTNFDVHHWAQSFLEALDEASAPEVHRLLSTGAELEKLVLRLRAAPNLFIFIDYDGTLMPYTPLPELAAPDPEVLDVLTRLCARSGTTVQLYSGRDRSVLEKWLGHLPIGLHAEYGCWTRPPRSTEWSASVDDPSVAWKEKIRPILDEFAARTPGAFVEDKTMSIAWHYRQADSEFGQLQAKELRLHLGSVLTNAPVEVLQGARVIEVRRHLLNRAAMLTALVANEPAGTIVLSIGNARAHEDFSADIPAEHIAIHVGPGPVRGQYLLANAHAVRMLLRQLVG